MSGSERVEREQLLYAHMEEVQIVPGVREREAEPLLHLLYHVGVD